MSADIDRIKNDQNLPITTYSINIQTSTPKRPLTCYITTTPRTSNQLNYFKPSLCLEKSRDNKSRSSIHLPVTYSTSIHVPCRPPIIAQRSPIVLPSPSSHHHYHHYHHHYYHHHQRQSLPRSTTIKHKISPRPTSIASTRPATTSTTTITSPDSSSSPSKKPTKNIPSNKQSSHLPPPLPSYSNLVWNWFHHTPTKPSSHRKGSQSDYSETYRHELPSKRSLLFKLLTSPIEKPSKSKQHRPCFTRKRLESSSSLPNKSNHYHE